MHWNGTPYVPFGGFGIKPGNPFGLDTYNLWIDFDPFIAHPSYTRTQHLRHIATQLEAIRRSGGTCIVQFSMALPHLPRGPHPGVQWREPEGGIDGSLLALGEVREAIFKVWAEYAPVVRNRCVRAVVLWNEINTWRWPPVMSVEQYVRVLSRYVKQVKQLIGNVPVCFKSAGTWNAEVPISAAAAAADGLGLDVWFRDPSDGDARWEIERALRMLEARQKKTTWFFIAEGGRSRGEGGSDEEAQERDYWSSWPPFRSKKEGTGILRAYARCGAKGFIYNGPSSEPESRYRRSYLWLGELKPRITRLMVETKHRASRSAGVFTPGEAISAARSDPRVKELLKGVSSPRFEAEFSYKWRVWIVRFSAGDRAVGFASVSRGGKVLEAGPPGEGEAETEESR